MVNLVLNENMKIYRRVRTWVLIGLMATLVLYINFIEWHSGGKKAVGRRLADRTATGKSTME